jgi:hypothetical protein
MKLIRLLAMSLCLLPLHGCSSENTDKWQTGTTLYFENREFGTITSREGDSIKYQTPESDFNRPAHAAQSDVNMLASRGVYTQ